MRRDSALRSILSRALGVSLALSCLGISTGCQSMQDGARQVSLGARDLGNRMAAPFRRNSPASPDFGDRSPGYSGEKDPFLPPPRVPDEPETSMLMPPRTLDTVLLGNPVPLPVNEKVTLASKPAASR